MKKNLIIGLLTLVSILSLSYAYYQKDKADKNELKAIENERLAIEMRIKAEEQMKMAEEQRKLADQQRIMAEANAMEAMRQRQLAQDELNKRRGTK